jgi:hypothetical protein
MRKTFQKAKQQPCRLTMSKIYLSTAKLVVYCDASFATNWDLTSQIGFIIFLRDSFGKICLLDGASKKCDRVTRSIMSSELYAITLGFDLAFILRDALFQATNIYFDIAVITDSMKIFDAITKLTQVRKSVFSLTHIHFETVTFLEKYRQYGMSEANATCRSSHQGGFKKSDQIEECP